jgi:hypothetical protein
LTLINFSGGKEWAGHLVRMTDDGTEKKSISEETRRNKKSRKAKIKVARLLKMTVIDGC